jgi:hypothetical protein
MMLTQERLKEVLNYDPSTGMWTNLICRSRAKANCVVGGRRVHGYVAFNIDKRRYYSHQLAFLYMTGSIPKEIDHIDGDRANNKWENLRIATRRDNNANRKPSEHRILPKGVTEVQSRGKRTGRFFARVSRNNKGIYLGCFSTPEEAHEAYVNAAKMYYGEFARTK